MNESLSDIGQGRLWPQVARSILGGTLMGLANLVPGISGGTMLLAAGVYPQFIQGIAEVTTLRFQPRTLIVLGSIVGAGALAILALAGVVRGLVVDHRWVMYSLFIGLTLGGIPVVWRLLRPATLTAMTGCAGGIALMAAMAFLQPGASGSGDTSYLVLFFAGLAGASAMILPGVSGGYLLLVLGQYITILSAIEDAKMALLNAPGPDWNLFLQAMHVFVPVGLGVAAGVVGVSNVMRYLLERFEKVTLGFLLGLLLGAVLGLWPFQQGVAPKPGDIIKGRVMTPELVKQVEPKDFPLEYFSPAGWQMAGGVGLVVAGFLMTQAVALLGAGRRNGKPGGPAAADSVSG